MGGGWVGGGTLEKRPVAKGMGSTAQGAKVTCGTASTTAEGKLFTVLKSERGDGMGGDGHVKGKSDWEKERVGNGGS